MTFSPQSLRGAQTAGGGSGQVIDYRLVRRHVIAEHRRGRLSRQDICDAHPELLRAARGAGRPSAEECPICEAASLVLVSYVFGSRLPPQGRCIESAEELAKLARRRRELACYVVEVCLECSWNHLARSFRVGADAEGAPGNRRRAPARR